ncbi:MAG: DUF885 family protein, partial [Gemmatimonadaceae bacterium]
MRVKGLIAAGLLAAACTNGPPDADSSAVQDTSAPVAYGTASPESRSFAALADEYLDGWARFYPSIAAGNGLHEHDGALEDFSAEGIARQVSWFRGMKSRLGEMDPATLTPDERVDHRILNGVIDGWLLDLEVAKSWQRNPMIYASAIADGVHNLMTMESAPAEQRMAKLQEKLRQVPRLLDAARVNLVNPPRILAERGLGMFRGASGMLANDLPLALASPSGPEQIRMLDEAAKARAALDAFIAEYEQTILPRANGTVALGRDYVEARYRAEELIDIPTSTMLEIGLRELAREQALFIEKARAVDSTRDAMDVWRDVLRDHPARGELVEATRKTVDELQRFVVGKDLVRLP